MRISRGIVAGLGLLVVVEAELSLAAAPPRVAVTRLSTKDTAPDVAAALAELVAFELEETGRYRVVSQDDVAKLLKLKGEQQALGCDTAACAADLGSALEVDQFVAGSVTKVGRAFLVILKLLDAKEARVVKQIRGTAGAQEEEMIELVGRLTRDLVQKVELARNADAAPASGGPAGGGGPAAPGSDAATTTGDLLGSAPGDAFGGGLGMTGTGQGGAGGGGYGTIGLGNLGTIGRGGGSGSGRGYGSGSGAPGGSSGDDDKAFAKRLQRRLARMRASKKPAP